jgi:uncharacterized protein
MITGRVDHRVPRWYSGTWAIRVAVCVDGVDRVACLKGVPMKTADEIRGIVRREQALLADKYGVKVVGLFGSYARAQQGEGSDVDLLVDIVRPVSLLELVGAELHLSDVLGIKVDLVPKRDVREELREAILEEAIAI